GMSVTFFMFLMFWVPHEDQPVPIFEDWVAAMSSGPLALKVAIVVALVGIGFFVVRHAQLLVWNIGEWQKWRASGAPEQVRGTNAHTQQLAIPLTFAMAINVGFIVGLVYVPKLWTIVEYLFPAAMIAFLAVGVMAVRLYTDFFASSLVDKRFDVEANNSLAQMMPSFALSMVAVGLAAPAALSHNATVVGIAVALSVFFFVASVLLGLFNFVAGMSKLFEKGATLTTLPTLWVLIPILTVLGIATLRLDHGLTHTLEVTADGKPLLFLSVIFGAQWVIALLGGAVISRMDYFGKVMCGEENSPLTLATICPGVALVVMGHFFLNKGLVSAGVIEKFGISYLLVSAALIALQLLTGWFLLKLTRTEKKDNSRLQARPA
ncbi:MAG: TsoY family (seleno)protein, partial [Granulosicoccaceae bacterium]